MRRDPFAASRRIEAAFEREIRQMLREALPKKRADQSFEEWIAELQAMSRDTMFRPAAQNIARRMVSRMNAINLKAWQDAARWSSHNRLMYRLLQREMAGPIGQRFNSIIAQNAELISSVPAEVAQRLSARLARAQQRSVRYETMAAQMRVEFPRLTDWRIRVIARTEVAKASTALTEVRSQSIGINWFVWRTSKDGAVRLSHRNLEGVLMSWDDPPSPEQLVGQHSTLGHYLPGNCPNCRCTPFPLMGIDDVAWPSRVYQQGKIIRMRRLEFSQMSGVQERAA
ncbi:hypothetical protein DYQ86_16160 [Acidobacteria bacterium AB60]|nr:hypothetical protein DYQ86_16160 [Acidobacteria bacterium AB60]